MSGVRNRLEPRLGDRLVALHALPERPFFHAVQRLDDQLRASLLVLDQAQREFLIIVIRAQVGHVQRNVGKIAGPAAAVPVQGFIGHLVQIAAEPRSKTLKVSAIRIQLVIPPEHSP